MLLKGKDVQAKIIEELEKDIPLTNGLSFTIISIGDDYASKKYVNNKMKFANTLGINSNLMSLQSDVSQIEVEELIDKLNNDHNTHGIILQLPIPKHLDEDKLTQMIHHEKDIDGFSFANIGLNYYDNDALVSCTAKGIITMLDFYEIPIEGQTVCIAGRSNLVGKILSILFINRGATVITCNSKTKNIKSLINQSDIFVSSIGKAHFFTKNYFENKDLTVIDVGINFQDGKMVGDVDFEEVEKVVKNITPVPGGVGVLTVSQLMVNIVKAYKIQNKNN